MKNKFLIFIYSIPFFFICCTHLADKNYKKQGSKVDRKFIQEFKKNTDSARPYFAFIVLKNDTLIKNILSDQPVCLFGEKNMIITLDSSHQMLTNGDALNMYFNTQTVKKYSILLNANDSNAVSILFSFTQKDGMIPQITFDSGQAFITRLSANKCDGNFKAFFKTDGGDQYFINGAFQNAITNF